MWFRKRNRRQPAKTPARRFAWLESANRKRVLGASGCGLLTLAMIWLAFALLDRPVHRVEVAGQFLRVSPLEIEQTVLAYNKANERAGRGFVSLNLDGLKAAIKKIAWVDRVRIERRWPDGVRVDITEQVPGARWGEHGLLNARGELFLDNARFMPAELPQLNGPDGTQAEVASLYLKTYPRLTTVGLRLARVTLDPRGAWELIVTPTQGTATNDGGVIVRLGRQDVQERLERFILAASPLIAAHNGEVSYIDMRYSNGFAVGWTRANANLANKPSTKGSVPDA